jgi:hypothetical protein
MPTTYWLKYPQAVFVQDSSSSGILSCIEDGLNMHEGLEIFAAYSIMGAVQILEGKSSVSNLADVLTRWAVASFNDILSTYQEKINSKNASSINRKKCSLSMINAMCWIFILDDVFGSVTSANGACLESLSTNLYSLIQKSFPNHQISWWFTAKARCVLHLTESFCRS